MTWVKFHDRLVEGAKRGIPRALRFVYMELALKAAPLAGEIVLPKGMADSEAIHDLLGGDRKEVAAALKEFTAGDEPMLSFEDHPIGRVLVVTKWEEYNRIQTTSTERVRKHREKRRPVQSETPHETRFISVSGTPSNAPETQPSFLETLPRARARDLLSSPSVSSVSEGVQGEAAPVVVDPAERRRQLEAQASAGQDVLGLMSQESEFWRQGVELGTGAPCSAPNRFEARDLAVALVAHLGSLRGQPAALEQAIRDSAKGYAKSLRDGQVVNVRGYAQWLNAGNFKLRKPKPPESPKPPPAPGPSMTPEETAAAARAATAAIAGGLFGKP